METKRNFMNKGNFLIRFLFFACLFIDTVCVSAQPTGSLEQFSDEEGLYQSNILDILQDRKGFIWLATYNGLIRFNGYEFQNYQVQARDSFVLKSNRINKIKEDKYGRIWIKSNEQEAYCFDSKKEQFWSFNLLNQFKNTPFLLREIITTPSGRVWLLSDENGCVCIKDSLYTSCSFNKQNSQLEGNTVYNVLEDQDSNTWLLTDNGLGFISGDNFQSVNFNFTNKTNAPDKNQAFYSVLETKDEIWFGASRGQIWRYAKREKAFYDFKLNIRSNIFKLLKLNDNEIIILTRNNGFFVYNLSTEKLKAFNSNTVSGLPTKNLTALYVNPPNQFWFVNDQIGIYKYDFSSDSLSYFQSKANDAIYKQHLSGAIVLKDNKGNLWIQPKGGGFSFYDKQMNKLIPYFNESYPSTRKISNILRTPFFDKQGNLWFSSTSTYGLNKFTFHRNQFNKLQIENSDQSLSANTVRSVFEDDRGTIWIATKKPALVLYNRKKEKIGNLSPNGTIEKDATWESPIYCIIQDQDKNIWIGTKGSGVYKLTGTDNPFSYRVQHFQHRSSDLFSLSNNDVYCIFQDHIKRIWIGTWGGGLNLFEGKNERARFLHFNNKLKGYPNEDCSRVRTIIEATHGIIHVGTTNGLLSFNSDFLSPDNIHYHHYKALVNDDIMNITSTPKGALYLGTLGNAIYRKTLEDTKGFPLKFQKFAKEHTIPFNGVLAIQEDSEGKIWIVSEKKLVRFDPQSGSWETFPELKKLLSENLFSEATICTLSSGEIMIGYSNGIIYFNPSMIKPNNFVPYLAFTNFQLLRNSSHDPMNDPFSTSIDELEKIVLSHNQNFFKIQFAALDYNNRKNIQYRYKLEGLEENWNYLDQQRTTTYTNIPKGKYLFSVSSTNGNGIWTNNERQLQIIIKPSLWNTPIAYIFYALLAIGLFILVQENDTDHHQFAK